MTASTYLLEKIARHGSAVSRLAQEIRDHTGEFSDFDANSAVAFDAADFVWSFLCVQGNESAQESRYIRNAIAERIIDVLNTLELPRV